MGRKITVAIFVFFLLPFVLFSKSFAQTKDYSGGNWVLTKDEVVEDNYFAAGNIVDIYGKITQDAYLAGGEINIEGEIDGDLLVAGGNIKIKGIVKNNIRAVGGQIYIDGVVGKNVTVLGGTIVLSPSAKIEGSIVSAGGSISIDSPIKKTALLAGGSTVLGNVIGGNTKIYSDSIRITPSASIVGNLDYWTSDEGDVSIAQEAKITGKVNKNTIQTPTTDPQKLSFEAKKGVMGAFNTLKTISLISFLLVALLFIKLFPAFTQKTTKILAQKPWASLGLGFVTLFIAPIAFIVLLITLIGIPFAFIGLAVLAVFSYLSKLFVILWAGDKLLANKKDVSPNKKFLVGYVLFCILVFIPVISGFVRFFSLLFGLGAILTSVKDAQQ